MEWNDFLNPRSMLTPGVAGSLVMVIANTLWVEFMVPQKWSALILSFLLIIPILARFSAKVYENAIYFIFNGLIIFALSVNTNFAGRKIQEITDSSRQNLFSQQIFSVSNTQLASDNNETKLQLALNDESSTSPELVGYIQQADKEKNTTTSGEKPTNKEKNKNTEKQKTDPKRKFFQNWF